MKIEFFIICFYIVDGLNIKDMFTKFNGKISDMAIDIYQIIKDEEIEDKEFQLYLSNVLKYTSLLVNNEEINSCESLIACLLYILLNLNSNCIKAKEVETENYDNIQYYKILNSIFDVVNETYLEIVNNR